jgi:GTP cyclohydrolase III
MAVAMERVGKTLKVDPELLERFNVWADQRRLKYQDALDLAMHVAMSLDGAQCGRIFDLIDEGKPFRVEVCEAVAEETGVAGQHSGAVPSKAKRRDAG